MVWSCAACRVISHHEKEAYYLTLGPPGVALRYCKKCFPITIVNFSKMLPSVVESGRLDDWPAIIQ